MNRWSIVDTKPLLHALLCAQRSVHVSHVVVHGENIFEVGFVRKNVDHPGEHIRVENSPFGCASLLRVYGAEHAELGMSGQIVFYAIFRGVAKNSVPIPAKRAWLHGFGTLSSCTLWA